MSKYIFLTNIPTPYRTSFYNALHAAGLDLEVFYMRNIEADRNWTVDKNGMKHPFYIDNGFYRMVGRYHVHFNPSLIRKMWKAKTAEFIIGGGWNDPDVLVVVLLKRLGLLKNRLHFWSEANHLTIGASNDNVFKKWMRRFVFNACDGAQLSSGKMTEITLDKWGITNNRYVPLPNTIEEEVFKITDAEVENRYANDRPVFVMPVRLTEEIKGIMNFFTAIGADNVRNATFLVAGEGPDKEKIQAFIDAGNLGEHIRLIGHQSTADMVALYKKANVLVLPSFSDPSPLSLIEALAMKLPLLASERCGNHFETVEAGKNGYIFDPLDPATVKYAFERLMERAGEWQQMGEISAGIYEKTFRKDMVIKNFIDGLARVSDSGR